MFLGLSTSTTSHSSYLTIVKSNIEKARAEISRISSQTETTLTRVREVQEVRALAEKELGNIRSTVQVLRAEKERVHFDLERSRNVRQLIAERSPVVALPSTASTSTSISIPGVNAVTAVQSGQLAPYANYGSFVDMGLPGTSIIYLGSQAYVVQGTSVSTAYATGVAAGTKTANCDGWPQIQSAMQQKFVVPAK